jgi:hypothetical protein
VRLYGYRVVGPFHKILLHQSPDDFVLELFFPIEKG